MNRIASTVLNVLFAACVVLSAPVSAQQQDSRERLMLPVSPSTVFCGYQSRYDTRLVIFNGSERSLEPLCFGTHCGEIEPARGAAIEGPVVLVPLPSFMYVPRETASDLRLKLVVESSHREGEASFFTELPVVREREFAHRVDLVGVRIDEGYRQTLRIYGLDVPAGTEVRMRIHDLESNEVLHEHIHPLHALADGAESAVDMAPTFSMECDLSSHDTSLRGKHLRVELQPLKSSGAKIWAFVSITNNDTQHFYTILPD
jgi:hypothetical protein